jgi:O-antigen ligase
MSRLLKRQHLTGRRDSRVPLLSSRLEYAYYVALAYSVLGSALGLNIPILAGAMILVIAVLCIQQLHTAAQKIYAPIALLLACIASLLLIQTVVHGESFLDERIRPFITWILGLVIIHSLCLRPAFRLRYPLVLFILGTFTVPFLSFDTGAVDMARVDLAVQGGLSHPGGLAEWFGFCTIFFAIVGLESERPAYRYGAWFLAVGCLFIVTLTVERSPLFATVLALVVGFRRILKRGFVAVLGLVIVIIAIYEIGLFDQALAQYTERGIEQSGREILWPEAVERIWESPFVGVGISNVLIRLSPQKAVPPHNTFLYFALSSGVVPFTLLIAFWIKAFWDALRGKEKLFSLPYLIFTFVEVMSGDFSIMSPWALLTLSVGAGSVLTNAQHRTAMLSAVNSRTPKFNRHRFRPAQVIVR